MNIQKSNWEESYINKDNWVLSPKEEIVKFLNRFIRKRLGAEEFRDIVNFANTVNALDLGCGIGRQTLLLKEFGLNAFGIDISEQAINSAKQLCNEFGYPELKENFSVINPENDRLPFDDNFHSVVISDSVLDSMNFDIAKNYVKEIDRIADGYFYFSLISGNRDNISSEMIVETEHEKGTIQSYFTWEKIQELLAGTSFEIVWGSLLSEENLLRKSYNDRYYIVTKNSK